MSLPTRQLQNLAIGGEMISNRSRAQRRRRQHEAGQRAATEAARHATPISGRSGLAYNVSQLNPVMQQTVAHGLQSENIVVDFSILHVAEDGPYYAFQLREVASVRVCDPAAVPRKVTCTCESFKRHADAALCAHIYWLYDGLNHALGSTTEETILPLDKDSVEGRFGEFREAIEKRINHLPQMLNQVSDELANNIEEITKDMLGIFVDLDDEFYSTIPTMEHQQLQELVVPQNLPATVFALAQHDPIFRDRLRNVVTKDVCAQDFLDKLDQKRRRILQAYDQYVAHGPQLRPRFVNECAVSLRHIITEISAYRESDRAPLSSKFDTMSAELALRMLEDVCDRNLDIYEHSTWQTSEDDPEEDRDCNLFANLISDPAPRYRDNFFVLDLFTEQLPVPAWLDLLGELERLMVRFTEQDAGTEFTKRMQDLIAQSQASEQLYEEAEEAQSPTSPADQWRHTQEPAGSSAGVLRGHHRRPTIDDKRSPRRRRLE